MFTLILSTQKHPDRHTDIILRIKFENCGQFISELRKTRDNQTTRT